MKFFLILTLFFSILISSQENEYKKYLDNAYEAIEKKDEANFLKNIKYFSTAIDENKITPANFLKENLILYAKCIYWAKAVNEINLPTEFENQVLEFMQYAANNYQDGASMFFLGYLYESGKGGANKDYSKAKYWYEESMKKNIAGGFRNLAYMYRNGRGVENDYQKAIDYFQTSLKLYQNQENTKYINVIEGNIGFCLYKLGRYDEAIPLIKKSIENKENVGWLSSVIGNIYYNGNGVTKDYITAEKYYTISCNENDDWGCANLAGKYQYIDKNYTKAVDFYKKALQIKHNDRAAYELGRIYYTDFDGENFTDYNLSKNYFLKVSKDYEKYGNALNAIGNFYLYGKGVEKNYYQAFKYYKEAGDIYGVKNSLDNLGYLYGNGYGIDKDMKQAVVYHTLAVIMGEDISNIEKVDKWGYYWYDDYDNVLLEICKKYKQNTIVEGEMMYNLGMLIKSGYVFKKSNTDAKGWFQKSCSKDYKKSCDMF